MAKPTKRIRGPRGSGRLARRAPSTARGPDRWAPSRLKSRSATSRADPNLPRSPREWPEAPGAKERPGPRFEPFPWPVALGPGPDGVSSLRYLSSGAGVSVLWISNSSPSSRKETGHPGRVARREGLENAGRGLDPLRGRGSYREASQTLPSAALLVLLPAPAGAGIVPARPIRSRSREPASRPLPGW